MTINLHLQCYLITLSPRTCVHFWAQFFRMEHGLNMSSKLSREHSARGGTFLVKYASHEFYPPRGQLCSLDGLPFFVWR